MPSESTVFFAQPRLTRCIDLGLILDTVLFYGFGVAEGLGVVEGVGVIEGKGVSVGVGVIAPSRVHSRITTSPICPRVPWSCPFQSTRVPWPFPVASSTTVWPLNSFDVPGGMSPANASAPSTTTRTQVRCSARTMRLTPSYTASGVGSGTVGEAAANGGVAEAALTAVEARVGVEVGAKP